MYDTMMMVHFLFLTKGISMLTRNSVYEPTPTAVLNEPVTYMQALLMQDLSLRVSDRKTSLARRDETPKQENSALLASTREIRDCPF